MDSEKVLKRLRKVLSSVIEQCVADFKDQLYLEALGVSFKTLQRLLTDGAYEQLKSHVRQA